MKIFIGGSKTIRSLDNNVTQMIEAMIEDKNEILIGDCSGVDTAVQRLLADEGYNKVMIYACDGKARNNVGGWKVIAIPVTDNATGFEYYRQKDVAMAEDADCGLMIWDKRSKGTLSNLIELTKRDKGVIVYFADDKKFCIVRSYDEVMKIAENKTGIC